jgi:glycosidase
MISLVVTLSLMSVSQAPSATPFDWRDVVLYHVETDRFFDGDSKNNANAEKRNPAGWHGGDFRGLLAKVDYLKSLGVNAVWFSPVAKQVDKPHRTAKLTHWPFHGYWPARFDEIEPRFGSRADLLALTKGLRTAGFRVVLDVVLNHVGYGAAHPGIRTTCGKDEFTKCLFGLPDLRTEDPAVWEPLVKAAKQLVDDTSADAVRLDAANHIAPAEWRTFRRAIAAPLLIGELWGFDPAAPKSGDALRARDFDTAFDFAFADLALGWVTGRLATESLAKHLAKRDAVLSTTRVPPIHFLDTHDTEPFLSRARRDKSALKLAATLQFAVAGIPLVNYGNEVGRKGGRWPTNRGDMPWGAAQDKRLLEFYKRLIYARRVDPNLRRAKSTVSALSRDLLMVLRGDTVVLLNRGRRPELAKVAVANAKSWVDLLTEKKLAARNLTVPPRTARILVRAE